LQVKAICLKQYGRNQIPFKYLCPNEQESELARESQYLQMLIKVMKHESYLLSNSIGAKKREKNSEKKKDRD